MGMSVRTAVVLAAGEGTRLRPLTRNRPKPMLPAANRPILEHVLDALVDAGLKEIVIVVGYRRERVQEHFGPEYRGVPLRYVIQGKQLGSGHALLQAREAVSGPVLVVNGDRLIEAGAVVEVTDAFEADDAPAAMAVVERQDTRHYGAVRLRDRDIAEIVEKPRRDDFRLINAGIYAFEDRIFEAIEATERDAGELALTDTIAELIATDRVRGVRTGGMWVDATYPWDLLEVAAEVLARGRVRETEVRDGIWVDADAQIHEGADLQAPVVIGPDCEVAASAVVGPGTALGRNVTVGPNVTVEGSVVDDDGRLGAGSTVLQGVFGQTVRLGAGTTVPGGPADVRIGQRVHEDQELGAVLADRVQAAGAVNVAPGTLVGPNVTMGTGVTVSGTVQEGAEVVR